MRALLVDGPASIGARARARRWDLLSQTFPDFSEYRVLDLGGAADSWLRAQVRPKSVTMLNLAAGELGLESEADALPDWLSAVVGDACDPPASVREDKFDLVFSNSLIEHVGGPVRRKMLADVVQECAPRYWIQTPYRYFPVEPHWLFPGFQFLPLSARARLSRWWPLMHTNAGTWEQAVAVALDVELLSLAELRYLFPSGVVLKERFAGLTKSLVAVRA